MIFYIRLMLRVIALVQRHVSVPNVFLLHYLTIADAG